MVQSISCVYMQLQHCNTAEAAFLPGCMNSFLVIWYSSRQQCVVWSCSYTILPLVRHCCFGEDMILVSKHLRPGFFVLSKTATCPSSARITPISLPFLSIALHELAGGKTRQCTEFATMRARSVEMACTYYP